MIPTRALPTTAGTLLAAKADSPQALGVSAPVGFELDPLAGAFGKVFAAALANAERAAMLAEGLPRYTARSIVDGSGQSGPPSTTTSTCPR